MANFAKGFGFEALQDSTGAGIEADRPYKSPRSTFSFVNKQNCRIWDSEYPKAIIEKPLHAQRVPVWCAMWSGVDYKTYDTQESWRQYFLQ
uniref:SFRICE_013556 n=1 Tax=Spodoptera frugiperda TaxID=7108 RepID=A0A2H1VLL0_SPOFR